MSTELEDRLANAQALVYIEEMERRVGQIKYYIKYYNIGKDPDYLPYVREAVCQVQIAGKKFILDFLDKMKDA